MINKCWFFIKCLSNNLKIEVLGHRIGLRLPCLEAAQHFPQSVCTFLSPHPHQNSTLIHFNLSLFGEGKWHLIAVSTSISLVTMDVQLFFTYILVTHLSFWIVSLTTYVWFLSIFLWLIVRELHMFLIYIPLVCTFFFIF